MRILATQLMFFVALAACSSDNVVPLTDAGDATAPNDGSPADAAALDGALDATSDAALGTAPEGSYVTVTSSSEFTPCRGQTIVPEGNGGGPLFARLAMATSTDGLAFTRTGKILADQADVPDAITLPNGEVRVYYIAGCPQAVGNKLVFASSTNLTEWTYRKVTVNGTNDLGASPVDPTVERTDEGRYRLYFTSAPKPSDGGSQPTARTYSAISDDGVTFTVETGARFVDETNFVLDPSVLKVASTWHYFAGGIATMSEARNYHATSTDGLTFTRASDFGFERMLMANGLQVPGGYRYYGFEQSPQRTAIRSVFTTDGTVWKLDDGYRLDVDPQSSIEQEGVKDPAVTRLSDGTYVMVYSTVIKGVTIPKGAPPDGGPPPSLDGSPPLPDGGKK